MRAYAQSGQYHTIVESRVCLTDPTVAIFMLGNHTRMNFYSFQCSSYAVSLLFEFLIFVGMN